MRKKKKNFIITLTGPSGCGKSYVTDRILDLEQILAKKGLEFHPVRLAKYVTRPLRSNEIKDQLEGRDLDVMSQDKIPDDCELRYQTYGKKYGLSIKMINEKLEKGQSPVVVINDVRVVEEIKRVFPGQVLSLFLFRQIPLRESFEKQAKERGGGAADELEERFNKATAIYRTYIENIGLFNRVILNPKDGAKDYAQIQVENVVRGVLEDDIKLSDKRNGKPKLFIIAGNAASGKDEIIQAVNDMGRLQATIIPKYTSRAQDEDDGNEMICKEIPHPEKMIIFKDAYEREHAVHINVAQARIKNAGKDIDKRAATEEQNLKEERSIQTPSERFWKAYEAAQKEIQQDLCERILAEAADSHRLQNLDLFGKDWKELRSLYLSDGFHDKNSPAFKYLSANDNEETSSYDEQKIIDLIMKESSVENDVCTEKLKDLKRPKLWELYGKPGYHAASVDVETLRTEIDGRLQDEFFVQNPDYLDLEEIKQANPSKNNAKAYYVPYEKKAKGYVLYENNETLYGFEVCSLPDKKGILYQKMLEEGKHCVLVASLVKIFDLVRDYFEGNIVTVFAYSEISSAEFEKYSKAGTVEKKMVDYEKEILKYSENIAHFDHVTIYAESELSKQNGGRKEELIDQIFRLFRYYMPKVKTRQRLS